MESHSAPQEDTTSPSRISPEFTNSQSAIDHDHGHRPESRDYSHLFDSFTPFPNASDVTQEAEQMQNEQQIPRSTLPSMHSGVDKPAPLTISSRPSPYQSPPSANAETFPQSAEPSPALDQIMSPIGSIASARSKNSITGKSRAASVRRMRSGSKAPTRFEPGLEGRPLDSPMTPHGNSSPVDTLPPLPSLQHYEYQPDLAHDGETIEPESLPTANEPSLRHQNSISKTIETKHDLTMLHADDRPSRAASSASKTTIPHSMFRDFDGVHFTSVAEDQLGEDTLNEERAREETLREETSEEAHINDDGMLGSDLDDMFDFESFSFSREPSPGRAAAVTTDIEWAEPPPHDGMVYYPAPIPAVLNVPPRLAKGAPAARRAMRRSQIFQTPRATIGQSQEDVESTEQTLESQGGKEDAQAKKRLKSSVDVKKLPPQLRASLFFDHQSVTHDIELKNGSPTQTLEALLDQSVNAPVSQVTDIVAPGHLRNRRSTASALDDAKIENRRSRVSLLSGPLSSTGNLAHHHQRNSSKLSMNTDAQLLHGSDLEDEHKPDSHLPGEHQEGEASDDHDEGEHEHQAEEVEDGEMMGPPTTLLAELQLRKHKLQQRNRTAAHRFPNGMHSTLLQMDAVEQIQKKKRQGKPTTLAWEDPNQHGAGGEEGDDEDVPLGMLFPDKKGLVSKIGASDENRPMGLIEHRDREENEPLSRRRNRLKGVSLNRATLQQRQSQQQLMQEQQLREAEHTTDIHPDEESEDEGETLAQRTRRLRSTRALDEAIAPGGFADGPNRQSRALSSDFASEMLTQLGGENEKNDVNDTNGEDSDAPEETLGQRRRRLQAEAQARQANGGSGGKDSDLVDNVSRLRFNRSSSSLGGLLSSNPNAVTGGSREVSGENRRRSSGLLGESEQRRLSRANKLNHQNNWAAGGLANGPLVDIGAQDKGQESGPVDFRGGPADPRASKGGFAGGMYNDGTAGVGPAVRSRASMMSMGLNMADRAQQHQRQQQMSPQPQQSPHQHPAGFSGGGGSWLPQQKFSHGFGAMQSGSPVGGGHQSITPGIYGPTQAQTSYFPPQQAQSQYFSPQQMQQQQQQMQMQQEQQSGMTPVQRDNIDRWRMSIMQ
ncbi:MAG: hypothetical protein M1831_005385 [Alyxoria varia]|nr:MAG: hypothetical protein M1831_005385 [Alyxoria varia]